MSKEGGYGKPIVYALLWQYLAGLVGLIISLVRPLPTQWGVPGKILLFFVSPPLMIGMGFAIAAFFFVIWHLMGSSHNYQTAFRIWALFSPLAVLSAVPYLSIVVILFYVFLLVTASVEVHGIRPTKAWTVWSILLGVLVLLLVGAGIVAAARSRLLSGQRGVPGSSMSTGAGLPGGDGLPSPDMTSPEVQKMRQAELERARVEFEKIQKESQAAAPQKKAPAKK